MTDTLKEWIAGSRAKDLAALDFEFSAPLETWLCLILLVLAAAGAGYYYRSTLMNLSSRVRRPLTALRIASVAVLLFLLLGPTLVGRKIEQGEQTVLLLFDDSQSMQVLSGADVSRGRRLAEAYESRREEFENELQQKYRVLKYRAGEGIERITGISQLNFMQPRSDLLGAVRESLQEWQENPVAAVVLFSDGVQQPEKSVSDLSAADLRGVPVFTVGVDDVSDWQDVALARLSVKKTNFDQSPILVNGEVEIHGLDQPHLIVDVLEGGQIVKSERYEVAAGQTVQPVHLEFIPQKKDWVEYTVRVGLEQHSLINAPVGETRATHADRVIENNSRGFLVDNSPKEYRILYVSGRPNWEQKFVRRALQEDEQLHLTNLIRISAAERKFVYRGEKTSLTNPLFEGFDNDASKFGRYDEPVYLRIGASESELQDGYPTKAEELFSYQLIVIGDAERDLFSTAQMERTRDFVSKRGGSLLLLGGPRSFTEGGFSQSPWEAMVPALMNRSGENAFAHNAQTPLQVAPSLEGELAGAWALAADAEVSRQLWQKMPPLYGVNLFALTRAGATVWSNTQSDQKEIQAQPFFALQRYGHGRCAVLATGETWPWHMDMDEDPSPQHRIWRQVIRSLVNEVPQAADLRTESDTHFVKRPLRLDVRIRDKEFNEREGLRTVLTLTTPSGAEIAAPVEESIQESGLYSSEFTPEETGVYRLSVEAKDAADQTVAARKDALYVENDGQEWLDPQYNPDFLREIAALSGGEFFPIDEFSRIVDRIPWKPAENAEEVRIQLWHHPLFFFLLPILMTVEWWMRRKQGQA